MALCLRKEFVGRGGWDYQLDIEFINETEFFADGFDHYFVHSRIESNSINGRIFRTYGRSKCYATIESAVTGFLDEEEWLRGGFSAANTLTAITHKVPEQLMVRRDRAWLTI